jgi:thymidine phosphorylase
VQKGEPLAELHLRGEEGAQKVGERVCSSFRIADRPAPRRGIVSDRVGPGA